MKSTNKRYAALVSVIAVQCALAALAAAPAANAAETEDLVKATNSVEVGVINNDKSSYKFGEYNGLQKKGTLLNGGLEVKGGDAYDSNGTSRWSIDGSNLGLGTRSLNGEFGEQGRFRIKFGHDEILRNQFDDYKTPYAGLGSSTLTLPGYPTSRTSTTGLANWNATQSPYATVTPATGATLANAVYAGSGPGVLLPAMSHGGFNIGTERKRDNFEATVALTPAWSARFLVKHEEKEGTKLSGVAPGTRQGAWVPEPVDRTTNQFRANLTYIDAKANLDFGYASSLFTSNTKVYTVANPFASTLLDPIFNDASRVVTPASNQMHRLSLNGGYNFSKTTRLVVSGYYQRQTQDEAFVGPFPATWTVPGTSPNMKVINKQLNATLTMKPVKDLSLLAQYKYEDRDNQSPSRTYTTAWADGIFPANANTFTNEPLNRKSHLLNLEGDYKLTAKQALKFGYQWEEIERGDNGAAKQALMDRYAAQFRAIGLSSEAESPWKSEKTKEDTFKLEYRNAFTAALNGRLAYEYSQRRTDYIDNEEGVPVNAPRSGVTPSYVNLAGQTITYPAALIPLADNIYFPAADPLLPGFRQYFLTDRNRDRLRGSVNFQASDALALQATLAYNKDDYNKSEYGLKKMDSTMFGLDATLQASETLSFNAFYSLEDKKSEYASLNILRNTAASATAAADPTLYAAHAACTNYGALPLGKLWLADWETDACRKYSETQKDRVNTFGLGFKAVGLAGGKVDVNGDISYSRAVSPITFTGGSYFGNGTTSSGATATAFGSANTVFVPVAGVPDITSEVTVLRLSGKYQIDKKQAIRVNYQYSHLKSSDWQWDAYNSTPGTNLNCTITVSGYVGNCMRSPNYSVNTLGLSYLYSFK